MVGGYLPIEHWSGPAWVWGEFLSYAGPPGADRWVDVNRTTQLVTLYEGDVPVATYWAAMGADASDDTARQRVEWAAARLKRAAERVRRR